MALTIWLIDTVASMQARVTLIDVTGVVLGDSEADVETMLNHLQRPEIVQARNSGIGIGQRFSDTLAYDALYVAVPVSSGADSQGYVRLAVPLRAIDQKVRALRRQYPRRDRADHGHRSGAGPGSRRKDGAPHQGTDRRCSTRRTR